MELIVRFHNPMTDMRSEVHRLPGGETRATIFNEFFQAIDSGLFQNPDNAILMAELRVWPVL